MRRVSGKSTKKYDGKTFYWYGSTSSRASAETSAEKLRAKGDLVRLERIIEPYSYSGRTTHASPNDRVYFIWRRKS